jgi:hypothetical protein
LAADFLQLFEFAQGAEERTLESAIQSWAAFGRHLPERCFRLLCESVHPRRQY